ncbi:MAG: SMP-30/gluconolactonase/LRE family protein [Pseudonocardia sp.]
MTAAQRPISVVLDKMSFLECPRWHQDRLWVSDFYTNQVLATDIEGNAEVMATVPGQPSGLGFLPDGRALIVSMSDRRLLIRGVDGALTEHADLSGLVAHHLNDMVVDDQGRAYVGNFGFDLMAGEGLASTVLVRVDPDGSARVVAEDMAFPNGSVILPDGTLVVAETFGGRLSAFAIDGSGELSNRREWARFGAPPTTDDLEAAFGQLAVGPDGMCADAEGAIWVADAIGQRVLRVREGGEILEEISTAPLGVFACMLGGADGRTLFMCAAPTFAEHECRESHQAQLLATQVDVPHAGRP